MKFHTSGEEITGEEQLSFYPDGNVVLTNRAASIAGTYQVTREGSLKLNLQFLQFFRVSETRTVKFKGDSMILIDEKGNSGGISTLGREVIGNGREEEPDVTIRRMGEYAGYEHRVA